MGLLGHRHYLVLGLPLMQSLGREQFAAVVAHEFGHFGGGDARFSGWIYRVRASWYRLLDALAAQRSGFNAPFVKFFGWYAPYFDAYSFVLARANEYRADAAASQAVGARAVGEALVRCELGALRLQRDFWPALERSIPERAAPPPGLYRDMAASLRGEGDPAWLPQLLARPSDYEDTHPTLAQRLAALGVEAGAAAAPAPSAAEALLGELLPVLEARFSEDWREGVAPVWEERHRRHAQEVARLEALERSTSRSPDEDVEYARLSVALRPEADALALFRAALARAPDRADAHGQLGVLLLEHGDAAGVGHLKEAMRLDPGCTDVALHHLELHYRRTGDDAGLDEVRARWARLDAERARSAHARGVLTLRDAFLPHCLDGPQLEALEAALAGVGGIGAAWVARKRIDADPDGLPHFVLLLKWRGLVARESPKLQAVADALDLPGSFIVVTAAGRRMVARRLRKAAGEPLRPGR
ncbi:M48 family metallopeptidase [Luteimonas sp. Y-2-2-4F]|nr:M48 family metallopeptidase [Luteimonas sp. Y-2-2-4F]